MVGGLASVAAGGLQQAVLLGISMFCLQASIGALNDVADAPVDKLVKPSKPIAAGLVSRRAATIVGIASAVTGLCLSLLVGGPVVAGLGLAVLAAGMAYDFALKPTPWAGLCYSVAFLAVPVFGWWGAAGELPPRPELLLPIAALAGPTLQLANGLVDVEGDRLAGLKGPVVRLGEARAVLLLGAMQLIIHGVAWVSLLADWRAVPAVALLAVASGSLLAAAGWYLSNAAATARRERGWQAQAAAIVLLGAGWLAAVA